MSGEAVLGREFAPMSRTAGSIAHAWGGGKRHDPAAHVAEVTRIPRTQAERPRCPAVQVTLYRSRASSLTEAIRGVIATAVAWCAPARGPGRRPAGSRQPWPSRRHREAVSRRVVVGVPSVTSMRRPRGGQSGAAGAGERLSGGYQWRGGEPEAFWRSSCQTGVFQSGGPPLSCSAPQDVVDQNVDVPCVCRI